MLRADTRQYNCSVGEDRWTAIGCAGTMRQIKSSVLIIAERHCGLAEEIQRQANKDHLRRR